MRVKTLQILWHDKQAIFTADFEPNGGSRLATGGADQNVRVCSYLKSLLAEQVWMCVNGRSRLHCTIPGFESYFLK
jgi:hypothetical protein